MTNFHLKGRGYDLTLDNICPFPLMGSQLFARDVIFELTNKSTEWNVFLEVSNSRRRRTWSTHGRAAVWSNIIQVFYDKKWSCDHFGGFV